MAKFLVSWVGGDDIGVYEAEDADAAILASVNDAGYASLEMAADFIYDDAGEITLQATEVEEWEAWEDEKRDEAKRFMVPAGGVVDIAEAAAQALGVDVSESLNVERV